MVLKNENRVKVAVFGRPHWQSEEEARRHGGEEGGASGALQDGVIRLHRREFEGGTNVLGLKVGQVRQDPRFRNAGGKQVEDVFDANSHPANARATAALLGIDRDPVQMAHTEIIHGSTKVVHFNRTEHGECRAAPGAAIPVKSRNARVVVCKSWIIARPICLTAGVIRVAAGRIVPLESS